MSEMTQTTEVTTTEQEGGNKQVQFVPVFPTLIADIRNVGLNTQGLVTDAIQLAGDTVNYEGGFTTYFTKHDIESSIRGVKELKAAVYGVAMAYCDQYKYEIDREACNIHLWVSVIRKGGWHGRHIHPRSQISGTYWAQADDKAARIVFCNPTAGLRMHEPYIAPNDLQEFTSPTLTIQPESDMMMMWPSWLEHEVMPSEEQERPRVAYSFNIDFLPPGVLRK
jgi:uncharacterized protein (TIGR02466 family)